MTRAFVLNIILFTSAFAFSQTNDDAQMWTGIGLEKDINQDLSLEYESQVRFNQNMTSLSNFYNELSLGYDFFNDFSASLTYRFARKNRGDYYANENRFAFDLQYGKKIKPISTKFSVRGRYQYGFDRLSPVYDQLPDFQHMARFRIKAQYKNKEIKRLQPYLKYEVFHALSPKNNISKLDSYRVSFGLELDLPKKLGANLFFMYEHENRSTINRNFIYGIQLNYKIKGDIIEDIED